MYEQIESEARQEFGLTDPLHTYLCLGNYLLVGAELAPPLPVNQYVTHSTPSHQLCKSSEQRVLFLWPPGCWHQATGNPAFVTLVFAFPLELSTNKLCLHTSRLADL